VPVPQESHDHILLSGILDSLKLEAQVPHIFTSISPRNKRFQLHPPHPNTGFTHSTQSQSSVSTLSVVSFVFRTMCRRLDCVAMVRRNICSLILLTLAVISRMPQVLVLMYLAFTILLNSRLCCIRSIYASLCFLRVRG
jgi:hypothetical protein